MSGRPHQCISFFYAYVYAHACVAVEDRALVNQWLIRCSFIDVICHRLVTSGYKEGSVHATPEKFENAQFYFYG